MQQLPCVSHLPVSGKVFGHIILDRIRENVEKKTSTRTRWFHQGSRVGLLPSDAD